MEHLRFKQLERKAEIEGRILEPDKKLVGENISMWYVGYYNNTNPLRVISKTCSFNVKGMQEQKRKYMKDKNFKGYKIRLVEFDMTTNNINLEPSELDKKVQLFVKASALKSTSLYSFADIHEYVVIDTETTGIGKKDQVVDIAAVYVSDGEIVDRFQRFINPTVRINPKAEAVHGLSKDFLLSKGREANSIFQEFSKFLKGMPVVGHNVTFDKRMIERHSEEVGFPIKLNIAFDTLLLSRKILDLDSHKLENIIKKFGLDKGLSSHSALDDAIASKRYADLLKNTKTI